MNESTQTLNETFSKYLASTVKMFAGREDITNVAIESAVVDGTEKHSVLRITYTNGNTTGRNTDCGRQARGSFSATAPVTCKKCLRYADR